MRNRSMWLTLIVSSIAMSACGGGTTSEAPFSSERVASWSVVDETERCTDRDDPELLLPDLVAEVRDIRINESIEGRRVRFSSVVYNYGEGPLIMQARTVEGPNGESISEAWQQIWKKDGSSCVRLAGEFEYHYLHTHWHFDDFNRYELRRGTIPLEGEVVGKTSKVSFCIADTVNQGGFHRQVGSNCGRAEGVQGLSVGWGDMYDFNLIDQYIDVDTDPTIEVPAGQYILSNIADPNDRLWELDDSLSHNMDYEIIDLRARIADRNPVPTSPPPPTRISTPTPVPTWTPFPTRTIAR